MPDSPLTSFWIDGPDWNGPVGYGVTAFSFADARAIIEASGYSLPAGDQKLGFRTVRSIDDVPHRYVREHSGPVIIRALWYPFTRIGVPS